MDINSWDVLSDWYIQEIILFIYIIFMFFFRKDEFLRNILLGSVKFLRSSSRKLIYKLFYYRFFFQDNLCIYLFLALLGNFLAGIRSDEN